MTHLWTKQPEGINHLSSGSLFKTPYTEKGVSKKFIHKNQRNEIVFHCV